MTDEKRDEWKQHLTPELRDHFERIGEELVQFDVAHHNYKEPAKHFAAIYWLGEKRIGRDNRESRMFWLVVVSVIVSAFGLIPFLG